MSSRQLSNVQDRHGVLSIGANSSPTDNVRLPYTPLDSHPNLPKYPPRHPGRGVPQVPPITSLAHGIHDPEQARLSIPPDSEESQKRILSKPKSDPANGRTSKVPECFIDDDDNRDGSSLFHAATEAI